MTTLRTLLSRSLDGLLRRRRDRDLDDEVQAHLNLLTDEHIARGMGPEDARIAALKAFGGVDQVKSLYRDQRGLPFVDAVGQDIRAALRMLRRDQRFTLTAVLVLALGLGISHMFLTLVYAYTLRGLPLVEAERVLDISMLDERVPDRPLSWREFDGLRAVQGSFETLAAFTSAPVTVGDIGRAPERFDGAFISAGVFETARVSPVAGRLIDSTDERVGAEPVVVLGADVWASRYGGDVDILGRSILADGLPAVVVGIVPERAGVPSTAKVWLPAGQLIGLAGERADAPSFRVYGRLRPDVTVAAAQAEIDAAVSHLARQLVATPDTVRARAVPINERFFRFWGAWYAFATAALIIMLVSATNVANLMLVRALHRAPEMAVRTSLGASRGRLVRQLLVESGVLAAVGGLGGLAVSSAGARVHTAAIPEGVTPYWVSFAVDTGSFAILLGISFAAVLIFGVVPAIQASRIDVNRVLNFGGRTGTGPRAHRRLTAAFLTAEIALAMSLFGQVGLAGLTSASGVPTNAAVDTPDVVTATLTLPTDPYSTPAARAEFVRLMDERLGSHPALVSHTWASALPLSGGMERRLAIAGRPLGEGDDAPAVWSVTIGPRYFETLRLPIVRGRDFTTTQGEPATSVAMINERFAELYLPDVDPIGRHVALSAPGDPSAPTGWLTIVGVAPTIRQRPGSTPDPIVYLPIHARPPATMSLLVRGEPAAVVPDLLRGEVVAVDAGVALFRMRTLAGAVEDAQWAGRMSARLAQTISLLALVLATVGLYAVTAHGVGLRTREIGLRMALGARRRQIVQLVLRDVRTPLFLGFALAVAGALLWDRVFTTGSPDLRAADPMGLLLLALSLAFITLVACAVPARHAATQDPAKALRQE